MKKIIFGTVVAAAVMLSACETLAPQEGKVEGTVQETEEVLLTAAIGADTKTFLEWDGQVFKTRWNDEDEFLVIDSTIEPGFFDNEYVDEEDYLGWFTLKEGAGESVATFVLEEGVLPESYYAVYAAEMWREKTGSWMMWFSQYQRRGFHETKKGEIIQGFEEYSYPMIAEGKGNAVNFKNLCSVLKVSVTGDGQILKNVVLSSMDKDVYLAGDARLDMKSSRPTLIFSDEDEGDYVVDVYKDIIFRPAVQEEDGDGIITEGEEAVLSEEPVECYLIIPAQTYPSGLKLTLTTDEGIMEMYLESGLTFKQSELRELPVFEYKNTTRFRNRWILADAYNEGAPAIFEEEGDWLVIRDYNAGRWQYLTVMYNDRTFGWIHEYNNIAQLTNTCGSLIEGGRNIELSHAGSYDLYLDPETLRLFIMTAGTGLDDIPTTEEVLCTSYWELNELPTETLVRIYGMVQAEYDGGFIMTIGSWGECIQVYTYYASEDIKARLSDIERGKAVELYATLSYRNGLPQLKDVVWCNVYPEDMGYTNYYATNITTRFDYYDSDRYDCIGYSGVLQRNGNYYNVVVSGAERQGSIHYPIQDLTEFVGKEVYVKGFFAGLSASGNNVYVNTILTDILLPDGDGSTEDVIPDEDIVITTR